MKVYEMTPGQQWINPIGGKTVTYIGQIPSHPVFNGCAMVIWWMGDRWSHDALSPYQDVGEPIESDEQQRRSNILAALDENRRIEARRA